ncbi:MAG TPA: methyltransferase domain-containing protein [Caulobacteraceae bacterium]|jgi:SAM-dependent methyltransferase|nr:methyltransferase domain-containing protein [Caulobacteraceae bacterium]
MPRVDYVCPDTHRRLVATDLGLLRDDGKIYPFLNGHAELAHPAPNFLDVVAAGDGSRASLAMYNTEAATATYRNFLDWLFATFRQDEGSFRRMLVGRLRPSAGDRVLVTGCGLGDDIPAILEAIGPDGEVQAQDISQTMVQEAAECWRRERPDQARQVYFSTGDALRLPFADDAFDAAFHFGGINLFDDIGKGIEEMNRVVRPGGRVAISDEGVGPWLRNTEYGRMVITNNRLWAHPAPIDHLPPTVADVAVTWVLGNCFWIIDFTVTDALPAIDARVPHKGWRGGSMWTRHLGQLEGVTPETRAKVQEAAAAAGLSVHDWLETVLGEHL